MEKLENDFGCWISSSSVANLQWDASGFHWFRFWALWIIGVTWNSIIFGQLHCKFFLFILVPFSDTLFMRFFNLLISLYEVFTFISSAFEYWKFVSFYLTLKSPSSDIGIAKYIQTSIIDPTKILFILITKIPFNPTKLNWFSILYLTITLIWTKIVFIRMQKVVVAQSKVWTYYILLIHDYIYSCF